MKNQKKKRALSKPKLKTIKNKLWKLCAQLTRLKYGNECYACGRKNLSNKNWHTAHLIPRSTCGAYLKYDLRNLRPCCYNCNINLGGNGAEFMRKMIIREGQEYVDQIFREQKLETKEKDLYPMLLEKYKLILEETNTLAK
jgi:hypothetical protein